MKDILSEQLQIRNAEPADIPLLYQLICELAEYEKIRDEVKTTEELLHDALFTGRLAEGAMVEYGGKPVGYMLYFFSFSSFIGLPGLYLEDIYIRPAHRGMGMGRACLSWLARRAMERKCWGLEWSVLDWNEPSVRFYEGLGAFHRDGWLIYRLKGKALRDLAYPK